MGLKPFVTAVSDYHEFDNVIRHFENAGFHLDFEEIGVFKSEFWDETHPFKGYHAVYFEKGKRKTASDFLPCSG